MKLASLALLDRLDMFFFLQKTGLRPSPNVPVASGAREEAHSAASPKSSPGAGSRTNRRGHSILLAGLFGGLNLVAGHLGTEDITVPAASAGEIHPQKQGEVLLWLIQFSREVFL